MQIKRKSTAIWKGNGKDGKGSLSSQSSILKDTNYGYKSRFEDGAGTNPEELIAAAHAGCFSMKLAFNLQEADFTADELQTSCEIILEDGKIIESRLDLKAKVKGIDQQKFEKLAKDAEQNCPISQLLNAKISLVFKLN